MGNQRQVLKDSLEKELVGKIQEAKIVLQQLNKNLEHNKQNSLNAKEEIRQTTELIKECIIQRKKDMIKEVESLHQVQALHLNEAVRSTYITLGKLEGALSNLDSFDQGQLINLRIPKTDWANRVYEPAEITVSMDCEKLQNELKEWGVVSADIDIEGFQCCLTNDLQDKSASCPTNSFPSVHKSSSPENAQWLSSSASKVQNVEKRLAVDNQDHKNGWGLWSVEEWVRGGVKSKQTSIDQDKDEFLLIPNYPNEEMDYCTSLYKDDDLDYSKVEKDVESDEKYSTSSIICIEKDDESEMEDLSKWLKPKKSKITTQPKDQEAPQLNVATEYSCKSATGPSAEKRTHASTTNNKFLEFPCLQMDAESWVRKKKPKSSLSICSQSSSVINEKGLIPPAYTLPNPFWLKKYR